MTQNQELTSAIAAGAFLAGTTRGDNPSNLRSVLISRLLQYDEYLGHDKTEYSGSLEEIQLETGRQALNVISRVQALLGVDSGSDAAAPSSSTADAAQEEYLIGTRDMAQMRTLLSIVFRWAIDPLLTRVTAAIPTINAGKRNQNYPIIDLTNIPKDFELLSSLLSQFIHNLLPNGVQGTLSPTHISLAILDRHLDDFMRPCIVLGWLPESLASDSVRPLDELRPVLVRLITMSVSTSSSLRNAS